LFPALLQTLKQISLINKTLWEHNGCIEELKLPTILMSHQIKKADLIEKFLTLAKEEFTLEATLQPKDLTMLHPFPECKV